MWDSLTREEYALAKKKGINPKTLAARVYYYDWSKDKAMNTPTTGDPEYKFWLNVAKNNDISQSLFSQRIHKNKMTYEEAATKPLSKRGRRRKVK